MTSLRRRIFIGSVLWTVGMLMLSALFFTMLMEDSPRARHIATVHRFFQSPITQAFGVCFLIVGALQVRRGLTRIDNLRSRLGGLRDGHDRRLDGDYPSEIQPLVDDLNALLATRERAIERAVAKAGDLAHGLKTPLAILAQDAERARGAGQHELAASLSQQVTRMRRQIDYHLSQARAAASGTGAATRSSVAESAEGLRRAMLRLFADRGISIEIQVPADTRVRVPREDLEEMLGNLIENACKWARSSVVVSAAAGSGMVVVTVDDDGSGIVPEMRDAVLKRGVRADEAAPGSGLGLAIVRDLAELYGGSITLGDSPNGGSQSGGSQSGGSQSGGSQSGGSQSGGLRASLRLPA